jgi:hypothetical protein
MRDIPLALQTAYAELVDRAAMASFDKAFQEDGTFVAKKIRGRRYWYFQLSTEAGRLQRYVGPETPELLDRIKRHKQTADDQRERRALVSTLIRSAYLPRPFHEIGEILTALSNAGVFRLRGVLVGTVAYQTYSAMLGMQLPAASIMTEDIDIAQSKEISIAVKDSMPSILKTLKGVDPTFREMPNIYPGNVSTTYETSKHIRVDFLTPNTGPDTDAPAPLAAFGTHAQQLRFLDFLIHQPEPAVVLHDVGIHALVPSPQRFAVHKLIISQRRKEGAAKREKDILQAQALLEALANKRSRELQTVWQEAASRGKRWKQLMGEGLAQIAREIRDLTLKTVGEKRSFVSGLDIKFAAPVARYDFDRDVITFLGDENGDPVRCAISREAIDDYFAATELSNDDRLRKFREERAKFERMMRTKYLEWPIENTDETLIVSSDLDDLKQAALRG